MEYIYARKGYPVQTWKVTYHNKGFDTVILVKGTEPEMQDYMESEFGYVGSYYALSKEEAVACKKMGFQIYLAPHN